MRRTASELLDLYEPGGSGLWGLDRFNFDLVMLTHALNERAPDNNKSAKARVTRTMKSPSARALIAAWEARSDG